MFIHYKIHKKDYKKVESTAKEYSTFKSATNSLVLRSFLNSELINY